MPRSNCRSNAICSTSVFCWPRTRSADDAVAGPLRFRHGLARRNRSCHHAVGRGLGPARKHLARRAVADLALAEAAAEIEDEDEDRNFDSRPQGGEASEGSRKGRGAAPVPGRRLTDRPGAVCGRHSSTVRRISARRAIAETWLRPVACGGARSEPSAPSLRRSGPASKGVEGTVRVPFLDRQRSLISEARALSHYSGEPLFSPANSRRVRG